MSESRETKETVIKRTFNFAFLVKVGTIVLYAVIIHYAVLPYLADTHVIPGEIIQWHNTFLRTLCTLLSLRLIFTAIVR